MAFITNPALWRPCFSYQSTWLEVSCRGRIFKGLTIAIKGKSAPPNAILPNDIAWRKLKEGHPWIIYIYIWKTARLFQETIFFNFQWSHKLQNSLPPGSHVLWPINIAKLKESESGSPNEIFYKIIWKSERYFLANILNVLTEAIKGQIAQTPISHVFVPINMTYRYSPREHFYKIIWKPTDT